MNFALLRFQKESEVSQKELKLHIKWDTGRARDISAVNTVSARGREDSAGRWEVAAAGLAEKV